MKIKMELPAFAWEGIVADMEKNKDKLAHTGQFDNIQTNRNTWQAHQMGGSTKIFIQIGPEWLNFSLYHKHKNGVLYNMRLHEDKITLDYYGGQKDFLDSWQFPKIISNTDLASIEVLDAEGEELPPKQKLIRRQMMSLAPN